MSLPCPDSVKQQLTLFFNADLQEFITSVERKNKLQAGVYSFSFAGKVLRPRQYQEAKHRFVLMKRHDVVNLHSLVNRAELRSSSEKQALAIKFNTLFFIAALRLKSARINSNNSSNFQ